jgi:hypothetical protein
LLAIVTYVENVKPGGWAAFDRCIHDNLEYTLGVDRHYYVARGNRELEWFYGLPKGLGDAKCISSVADIAHLAVDFVNVQAPAEFKTRGQSFEWLHNFRHPDNVCYVFGPNHGSIELAKGVNVSIPLKRSALYASSTTAIVLYDRRTKIETGSCSRPSEERNERDGAYSP